MKKYLKLYFDSCFLKIHVYCVKKDLENCIAYMKHPLEFIRSS